MSKLDGINMNRLWRMIEFNLMTQLGGFVSGSCCFMFCREYLSPESIHVVLNYWCSDCRNAIVSVVGMMMDTGVGGILPMLPCFPASPRQ